MPREDWQARQYDMGYYASNGSNVSLSTDNYYELSDSDDNTVYDSTITWVTTNSGAVAYHIGSASAAEYPLTADSEGNDTSKSAGDVTWKYSSNGHVQGFELWP